jgi:hypothetical protein
VREDFDLEFMGEGGGPLERGINCERRFFFGILFGNG